MFHQEDSYGFRKLCLQRLGLSLAVRCAGPRVARGLEFSFWNVAREGLHSGCFHPASRSRIRKVGVCELLGAWTPLPLTPSPGLCPRHSPPSPLFVPRPMLLGASCFWFDFLSVRINVYTSAPRSGSQKCAQWCHRPSLAPQGVHYGSIPQPRLSVTSWPIGSCLCQSKAGDLL